MIIGLGGFSGSGKDTVGKYLVDEHGFTRVAFADALKRMALLANPTVMVDGEPMSLDLCVKLCGGWDEAKRFSSVRGFLQRLGVAVRDTVGPDTWLLLVADEMAYHGDVVITDVRFPNELRFVNDWSGRSIYIVRPCVEPALGHVSESLSSEQFDHVLANDGSLADLFAATDRLLAKVRSAVA